MHAVLITAYKDFPSLARLVRRLDQGSFRTFIHIDRKSRISEAHIEQLESLGAEVSKKFIIRWGSFAHLEAIIHLMRRATDQGHFDYIHIISGQDYPLFDAAEFELRCDGRIFIDPRRLQDEPPFVRDRYELTDPFHFVLAGAWGSRRLHKFLTRKSHYLRSLFSSRRTRFGPYSSLHKAVVWSSFPGSVASHLLNDPVAHDFLRSIRNTRLPEEIFFATYFLNSEFASSVAGDDLRFTDWEERNGSNPAYLDESDIEAALRSNSLFARKMQSGRSATLLDTIDSVRFVR